MEAKHDGLLVRQYHPNLTFRISSEEGMIYTVKRTGPNDGRTIKCRSIYVSHTHCEIYRKDRAYWVKDIGSSNGTYLNGVRLTPNNARELRFGDVLGIGISHDTDFEELEGFATISPTSSRAYIFRFCQREEDLDVIDVDEVNVVPPEAVEPQQLPRRNSEEKTMEPPQKRRREDEVSSCSSEDDSTDGLDDVEISYEPKTGSYPLSNSYTPASSDEN